MKITARIVVALSLLLLLSVTVIDRAPVAKAAPLDLSGELHGAPFQIRVPEVWNGTLLIFAHGYRVQTFTTGVGHCNLTGPQILMSIGAIDLWVRTGVRPTAAQFPAPLGFNNAFVPPAF